MRTKKKDVINICGFPLITSKANSWKQTKNKLLKLKLITKNKHNTFFMLLREHYMRGQKNDTINVLDLFFWLLF
jgi:hypothetical protein